MIEIIPAIDIIGGKCVRLTKGDYSTKKEYGEPLDMAKQFEQMGVKRLHVVDLDGAKNHRVTNEKVLRDITSHTSLAVDFGGGLREDDDLQKVFDAGAELVTVGSIAVNDPDRCQRWLEAFGPERIILGADVRDGLISIHGWKEDSKLELMPFLQKSLQRGYANVLCTDISRDGMMQGPNIELYRSIMEKYRLCHLIASGGVSCTEDIVALNEAGIPAVVFGKAFYEGKIDLKDPRLGLC